ncbi:MAG: hypothetical protein QNJ46_18885 [Leptolyngbyaceae cyanobacterium MO_188.B28]|nr:hypothetical protein [Leptolyngbyaceae cyanobacterium MO_188.B28]
MHYLAKVQKKAYLGGAELQLLAYQASQYIWEVVSEERVVETSGIVAFNEGALVLVELSNTNQIDAIRDASDWVLELVSQYLTRGVTPEFLEQEIERAEQWRQSLTLQSQEVGRRVLETAARRDEIQELEKNLKLEREELERRESEIAARREEIQELEKKLKLEQQALEEREALLKQQEG